MACNSKGIVEPIVPNDFEAGDGIDISVANPAVISADINTTNLQITATEINTIQDIDVTATPTFAGLTVNLPADGGILVDGSSNPRTVTTGAMRQTHTPAITGTRALNYVIDMNNQPDTNGIVIEYATTGMGVGERGAGYQFDADTRNSTGGEINGIQIEKVGTGLADVHGVHAGLGVDPVHQEAGTYNVIEKAFSYDDSLASYADITTALGSDGTNTQLFVEDNDIVYVGNDVTFGALEVLLSIVAANPGVKPTFEFWNGSTWTSFGPSDGTNGFRLNGAIAWDATALTGWATTSVNGTTKYWIRIVRTTNILGTPPTESAIKSAIPTIYEWDNDGNIIANTLDINNFAGDVGTQMGFFNGQFLETMTATVTSDGATITLSLEKLGTGDLTMFFSDGFTILDTTPAATIALTAGSDIAPQKNYVYVLQSTKVLTISTSDWPSTEHIKVAEVVAQSASTVNIDGVLVNRYWNDHAYNGTSNQGHMTHITERLRYEAATWWSGVVLSVNITTNGGAADNVDIAVTAGTIYQLHKQVTDVHDTASGDAVIIPNDFSTAYNRIADLNTLLTDSTGTTMSGKYFNLVVWRSVSSNSENDELFINLPGGSYIRESDATSDVTGYDNFTIPSDFRGYAILVGRLTFKHSVAASGTWTLVQNTDLRGTNPNIFTASGVSPFTTIFADNTFCIFDNLDPTKQLQFQLSTITTGTTRTLTIPDESGIIATQAYADAAGGTSDYQGSVITRDASGFVSLITRDDATTATITRDVNNFVSTIVDTATSQTLTFTRDGDNLLSDIVVS